MTTETVLTVLTCLLGGVNIFQILFLRSTKRKFEAEADVAKAEADKARTEVKQGELDLIEVYPRTEYQIQTVKTKPRWGLGIQAGYGCTLTGTQVRLSPYIGVGVQYNLLTW